MKHWNYLKYLMIEWNLLHNKGLIQGQIQADFLVVVVYQEIEN